MRNRSWMEGLWTQCTLYLHSMYRVYTLIALDVDLVWTLCSLCLLDVDVTAVGVCRTRVRAQWHFSKHTIVLEEASPVRAAPRPLGVSAFL